MRRCVTIRYINVKYKERKNTLSLEVGMSRADREICVKLQEAGLTKMQAIKKIERENNCH